MTLVVALPSITPDSGEAKGLRVTRLNRTIILRLSARVSSVGNGVSALDSTASWRQSQAGIHSARKTGIFVLSGCK